MTPAHGQKPLDVLVAGGGVAGIETLLAVRDLARERVTLSLLAPRDDFVYRPMAVAEPFALGHAQHVPLHVVCRDVRARLFRGAVVRVDDGSRTVTTTDGKELRFDELVLAVGARIEPAAEHATTWSPESEPEVFGGLLRDLEGGYAKRVAFVVPPDVAWPLAAYELAMMTARQAWSMGMDDVDVVIVTAEDAPLGHFGTRASQAVREQLDAAKVRIETGTYASPSPTDHRTLILEPGHRRLTADRVVALPRALGPSIDGVPSDARGFVKTDEFGKVRGTEHVWAAGDGTSFPIKHGGLATEQADAAAESIAALAGADIEPRPFRPVLRGRLLTGGGSEWMRHSVAGGVGEGEVAEHALWWPPSKIAGRYLAPYLDALANAREGERPDMTSAKLDLERERT